MATAAAIAVGVAVATDNPQQTKLVTLTPAQVAELRPSSEPEKARPQVSPRHDDDDEGTDATSAPEDGDGEDGPGS
ncbi:MAG TPA: hypothetical protein VG496_12005 [Myxococcales bacterium]|nr:hypothetical protein [Myxococcales bacterium]